MNLTPSVPPLVLAAAAAQGDTRLRVTSDVPDVPRVVLSPATGNSETVILDPDQRLPSSVIRLARPLAVLHEAGERVVPLPYGDLRVTIVTGDGTTAVRIDQADPLILVTGQLVALWRDGPLAPYMRFDGTVFEVAGVNRTVAYRLGRHLPARCCYQAEMVCPDLPHEDEPAG